MNIKEEHTINIQDLINERNKQDKRIEELVLKLEKQEEVLNKIKEEVLTELQNCKPKDMAISMEINYIEEKLERLLEEIE